MNTAMTFLTRHWDRLALHEFGAPDDLASVLITPRFQTSAHVVFLILDRKTAEPVLVIKAARHGGAVASTLAREASNLRAVQALRPGGFDSIPRVITFEEYAGTPMLLETAVSGHVLKSSEVRRRPTECAEAVLDWVMNLHSASAQWCARTAVQGREHWTEPLERMARAHPLSAEDAGLVARTHELLTPLHEESFPVVFEHGDLSAPNILITDAGTLNVVDWELATPAGLPGQDLFFSLAFLAFARERAASVSQHVDAFARAFFGPRAWAWPYVERYADRLDLDRELLPALFVACWSTYVARRTERLACGGITPDSPSARWTRATRNHYFALWGHAVRNIADIALSARRSIAPIAAISGTHQAYRVV